MSFIGLSCVLFELGYLLFELKLVCIKINIFPHLVIDYDDLLTGLRWNLVWINGITKGDTSCFLILL